MEDANADIVYKKFNVPKDVEREWFIEGCKKRIQQFQQKLLLGTDASEDLWIMCNSFKSYLTDNEITFLFNLIYSNADRMTA